MERIAQDIDECLFNSMKKHHQLLTEIGIEQGWEDLPTCEEVYQAGGTHEAYGHQESYWEANKQMRNDPEFNKGLEVVEGSVEALGLLAHGLICYLTTRPENVTRITEEQLDEAGFPKREVICRPRTVPIERTKEWKTGVLTELAEGQKVVMIDDSVGLHETIKELEHPNIRTILFNGVGTPKGNGELLWEQITKQLS